MPNKGKLKEKYNQIKSTSTSRSDQKKKKQMKEANDMVLYLTKKWNLEKPLEYKCFHCLQAAYEDNG
jgi:hypothetical protein